MCGTGPQIEMQKALTETEAGEAARAGRGDEAGAVVAAKRDVESEPFVL